MGSSERNPAQDPARPVAAAEGSEEQPRVTGASKADLAAADAPGERKPGEDLRARQEQLIDEAIEETFPASDPIAPKRITK